MFESSRQVYFEVDKLKTKTATVNFHFILFYFFLTSLLGVCLTTSHTCFVDYWFCSLIWKERKEGTKKVKRKREFQYRALVETKNKLIGNESYKQ